jgi:hormone-sensitive lipase
MEAVHSVKSTLQSIESKILGFELEAIVFQKIKSRLVKLFESELIQTGNQVTGEMCIQALEKYLVLLLSCLEKPLKSNKEPKRYKIKIYLSKIGYTLKQLKYALRVDPDDLSSLPENNERFLALNKITKVIQLAETSALTKQYQHFYNNYHKLKAMVYITSKYKSSLSRDLLSGALFCYFSLFPKKAQKYAFLYNSFVNFQSYSLLLGMPDSKLMHKFFPREFDPILLNQVIYIPRTMPHVLAGQIEPLSVPSAFSSSPLSDHVKVRILSSQPLNSYKGPIILHAHGGGYLSLSSFSHELYTRKWANLISLPIFSIDYRKGPEFPFPAALDDIWQLYSWLTLCSSSLLTVTKIILVGDSAGGNLILALTLRLIELGFKMPEAILPLYPVTCQNLKAFSKTTLLGLEDEALTYPYFELMYKIFVGTHSPENHLISPVYAPQELLRKFPKTVLVVNELDPVSFHSLRFAEKLMLSGASLKVMFFKDVIHGALGDASNVAVPLFSKFVEDAANTLKELAS